MDVYFRSVLNDVDKSPFRIFSFPSKSNNELGDFSSRTGISAIGPKFKYAPFNVKGLSFQTVLLVPLIPNAEGVYEGDDLQPFIDFDAFSWFQHFFYDKSLNNKLNLFFEGTFWTRIGRKFDGNGNALTTPFKGFLSYFATNKLTFYGMSEWAPTYGSGGISSFYLQSGVGAKYQITKRVEAELLYTNFWLGKNGGAGQTYNLGFRYLH